jgi:UDP-N-acetylenolpyruvoylglucosamine reductase
MVEARRTYGVLISEGKAQGVGAPTPAPAIPASVGTAPGMMVQFAGSNISDVCNGLEERLKKVKGERAWRSAKYPGISLSQLGSTGMCSAQFRYFGRWHVSQ